MKFAYLASILILSSLAALSSADLVFYGGDTTLSDGALCGSNMAGGGEVHAFDDFHLDSAGTVTALFGTFFVAGSYTTANITQAHFEIRQGISTGNGGTLVASGTSSVSVVDTGLTFVGMKAFRIRANTNFSLASGNYFMSLMPVGNGGNFYISTTAGLHGVGSPRSNGNTWLLDVTQDHGASYGEGAWIPGSTIVSEFPGDFSYGVEAAPVPEPATTGLLILGVGAMLKRRRQAKPN